MSKCFNLIQRFSEDIDLTVLKEDLSPNQLKKRIRKVTKSIREPLKERQTEGITDKRATIRKIAYEYPKVFAGSFGQVRDKIIVEATWLGHPDPYTTYQLSTYIHDMLLDTQREELAKDFELEPFEVFVLETKRTLCEKVMSLVRFSNTANPINDLNAKIRYIYDIYHLLNEAELGNFFEEPAFEIMLLKVAEGDLNGYRNSRQWLNDPPKDALLFREPEATWSQLLNTYNNSFRDLVYGTLPEQELILRTLLTISERLKTIDWSSIESQFE